MAVSIGVPSGLQPYWVASTTMPSSRLSQRIENGRCLSQSVCLRVYSPCCDLCLFGSTHSLSCRTRRSGGTDGEVAYALRLCAGLRAGLGVAPRKSGLSHWTRPMLGICVMPRAPHLVHTSGIWGTGIEREASYSTLCRLGQTQSTQESKASKQQASHLLAELRRHDCYSCRLSL